MNRSLRNSILVYRIDSSVISAYRANSLDKLQLVSPYRGPSIELRFIDPDRLCGICSGQMSIDVSKSKISFHLCAISKTYLPFTEIDEAVGNNSSGAIRLMTKAARNRPEEIVSRQKLSIRNARPNFCSYRPSPSSRVAGNWREEEAGEEFPSRPPRFRSVGNSP